MTDEAAARIRALKAENKRLREALEPFAEYAGYFSEGVSCIEDHEVAFSSSEGIVTYGDLRRARAAIGE